jgi:hypothetical protein
MTPHDAKSCSGVARVWHGTRRCEVSRGVLRGRSGDRVGDAGKPDLNPHAVAVAARDSAAQRRPLVVSHRHFVAGSRIEGRVMSAGPSEIQHSTTRSGPTSFGSNAGSKEWDSIENTYEPVPPAEAGFCFGPSKCARTRPNCVRVGSESTTVQCG